MNMYVLACEVLRPELEMLIKKMQIAPTIKYLEQKLHDCPDLLRSAFQAGVDEFEQQSDGPLTILCGYGLCGRALCGVRASRAILVFPKLHDCVPLLIGLEQTLPSASSRDGATYWISPGWLESFLISFHLEEHKRFAVYEKKYDAKRAARMVAAENAMLQNYKNACHIRWPEMGDAYVPDAKAVAKRTALPYSEVEGSSDYMAELLLGGNDPDKFLRLVPGQTIDMQPDGTVCATSGSLY